MTNIDGSSILRGTADRSIGTAMIAVSSVVNWPQHITLHCLGQGAERSSAIITLPPQSTTLITSCNGKTTTTFDGFEKGFVSSTSDRIEAYELATDGGPGAIAAFGLAAHHRGEVDVFSGIPFSDPKKINSSNSVFAGVPFGTQPTLPDGVYAPRVSLANFADSPAHVSLSIATTQPGSDGNSRAGREKRILRELTIPARRTIEFTVDDASSESGLLQSLIIESDRKPGEVVGKVVSRSDGNLFEVELLGKDQMDENNGGIHPWSAEGDSESHLLLFNYSTTPRVFGVGISNGLIVWDKKYTLSPFETREININELLLDRVKDDKGQILDPKYRSGAANWMVPDSGEGTGRLMVTSHSRALARNFSCGNFIVVCGSQVMNYINAMTQGQTTQVWIADPQFCDEFSPSQCTGGSYVSNGSASYSWSIGASTVIRPNTNSDQYAQAPYVYGVGGGRGTGYVTMTAGGCQSGGSGGPTEVQVPTASRIVSTISNGAATDCPSGQAGWDRKVWKIVTDQETPPKDMVVGGQSLTETVTIGSPNDLGITGVTTGTGTTGTNGQFGDHFRVCSTLCPTSTGTTAANQTITDVYNSTTYTLTPNSIAYKCSSITVNGQ